MSGRRSSAVEAALRLVREGLSISESARRQGVAVSSVRRALRADGVPPMPRRPGLRPQQAAVALSPIVNVDVKMPRKMLHALGIFEAVSVVNGIEAVTEEQVRAFLTERHGADFAATFKPEYLFSTQGT